MIFPRNINKYKSVYFFFLIYFKIKMEIIYELKLFFTLNYKTLFDK